MQDAGIAKRSHLVGPLSVARNEEADALASCVLEDPRGVDWGELLADRGRPVAINLSYLLEVVQDYAGVERADQCGDAGGCWVRCRSSA